MVYIDNKAKADCLRILSADMVYKANSGHPGMCLGMADIIEVLWSDYLKISPINPHWVNRDRFIMSNGHGSALLYSVLHLAGFDIPLEELQKFRKLNSITAGHPEYNQNIGIETTTGPLGQGFANAIGMAIARNNTANLFNTNDIELIDHHIYVTVGDGCLMEGISHEVASLAGTLKLKNLIAIYDSNNISIDGHIDKWYSEDVAKRFEAYGWKVINNIDGHNRDKIFNALKQARNCNKPVLIIFKTIMSKGAGSKYENLAKYHGSPFNEDGMEQLRKNLNWQYQPFVIPSHIKDSWSKIDLGEKIYDKWLNKLALYKEKYSDLFEEFERRFIKKKLPYNLEGRLNALAEYNLEDGKNSATRSCSYDILQEIAGYIPELFGGSADLTPSNKTKWSKAISFEDASENENYNYLNYGVREFAMLAISNGIATYGSFIPFIGTFLVFSDYAKSAIRMAALMNLKVIYILTHDSIGVGEDGPTHQPVEQLAMLRTIPNLDVWRPCDIAETTYAWLVAILKPGPIAIILSRQNLEFQKRLYLTNSHNNLIKGGYLLKNEYKNPDLTIIASGSEVEIANQIAKLLNYLKVNIVSMPSINSFEKQDEEYKKTVIQNREKTVAIEASNDKYWYKFATLVIGINNFGMSAPFEDVYEYFDLTTTKITEKIKQHFKI